MFVDTTHGLTTIAIEHSLGAECGDALYRTVLKQLEDGQRAILVSLTDIKQIDAAGLGQLVRAFTAVCDRGGELKVVVTCDQIRELLDRTHLTTILPTFASPAEARASFASCISC